MSKDFLELRIENYDPILDQVFTTREAEILWKLEKGTVRAALNRDIIQGRKSVGTWLVSRRDMEIHYGSQPPKNVEELYQDNYRRPHRLNAGNGD